METIIDGETGEVLSGDGRMTIYTPGENDLAMRTDAELVALSEAALEYTIAELGAVPLEDAPKMRAQTQALEKLLAAHLRSKEAKLEAANNLTEARLRIERHVGTVIPQMQRAGLLMAQGGDRKSNSSGSSLISSLGDYAITYAQSSAWQKVARIEPSVFEDYIATGKENLWELSTAGLLWFAKGLANHQLINQSLSPEWYTPAPYVEAGRRVMGGIDVDPASCARANKTIRATVYYTAEMNGLDKNWPGRVWLNPPYGKFTPAFVARLEEQYRAGITTEAIAVINANSLITDWFAPLWKYTLCFPARRINFDAPDGAAYSATHGTVFVYLGPHDKRFYEEYRAFGVIMREVYYE